MHDGDVVLTIGFLGGFGTANDLRGNAESFALGDDTSSGLRLAKYLHAVPHIIDAEHFFVAGAACFLDRFENRWDRQEIILNMVHACAETDALSLAAA